MNSSVDVFADPTPSTPIEEHNNFSNYTLNSYS